MKTLIILFLMTVLPLQSADEMPSGSASDSEVLLCFKRVLKTQELLRHLDDALNPQQLWVQGKLPPLPHDTQCDEKVIWNDDDDMDKKYVALRHCCNKFVQKLHTCLFAKEIKTATGLIEEGDLLQRFSAYVPEDSKTFYLDRCDTHGNDKDKEEVFCQSCHNKWFPVLQTLLKICKAVVSVPRISRFDQLVCVLDIWKCCLTNYRCLYIRQMIELAKLQKFLGRSDLSPKDMAVIKSVDFVMDVQDYITYATHQKKLIEKGLSVCAKGQELVRNVRDGVRVGEKK
ncbi:MAG: hypothetical protein OXC30_03020 [Alphaproteobacteria bacterium]|nr:hypothetical protein [Alphaproteobacteria bacterium]